MAAPQGMIRGVIIKLPHTRDVTRKIVYWDHENYLLYGVVGCLLFRGCLSIEVNRRTVDISWVSTVEGCLLHGVPLYLLLLLNVLCVCMQGSLTVLV